MLHAPGRPRSGVGEVPHGALISWRVMCRMPVVLMRGTRTQGALEQGGPGIQKEQDGVLLVEREGGRERQGRREGGRGRGGGRRGEGRGRGKEEERERETGKGKAFAQKGGRG